MLQQEEYKISLSLCILHRYDNEILLLQVYHYNNKLAQNRYDHIISEIYQVCICTTTK